MRRDRMADTRDDVQDDRIENTQIIDCNIYISMHI